MRIHDLLPGWALRWAYAFRRAFLLRRHRYALKRLGPGEFGLERGDDPLPHRRVLLDLGLGQGWAALELRGVRGGPPSGVPWEAHVVRAPGSEVVELDLPHGLHELVLGVHPAPASGQAPHLEVQEVGWLAASRASLGHLLTSGFRRALREARAGGGGSGGTFLDALRHSLWTFEYRRWLRTFQLPQEAVLVPLRRRVAESGIRLSVVLDSGDPRSLEALSPLLPGQLEVCRTLEDASGEAVVLLGAEVVPVPNALLVLAALLLDVPEADLLHADDDRIEVDGTRSEPSFKPEWSPEQLRARNFLGGLVAIRRAALPPVVRGPLDRARRYDLLLACAEVVPPERIARVPFVLASLGAGAALPDVSQEDAAVLRHLQRRGVEASLEPGPAPGLRRVRYRLPAVPPKVSIVVPTRNARALVENCVQSVRRLTAYPDYEIVLVDNGSDDPQALAAFDRLASTGEVRLLRDPRPFNFPALNNRAVASSQGPVLCLLNNDIEALHPDWLEEMVSLALQPGIGAVGAKLLYPGGTIQHAGVLVGFHASADHLYAGFPETSPGLDQQLRVRREVSAVTAACLVVRRSLYEEVGGLDEQQFPVAFNDVDFCLKLRARGLRNLWTPHARLIHHESASRGRTLDAAQRSRGDAELDALRNRWKAELAEDPYHSPNLTLDSKVPRLAWPPRTRPPWVS